MDEELDVDVFWILARSDSGAGGGGGGGGGGPPFADGGSMTAGTLGVADPTNISAGSPVEFHSIPFGKKPKPKFHKFPITDCPGIKGEQDAGL